MTLTQTEALAAVLEGDENHCQVLLSTMNPNELHELWYAVSRLRSFTVGAYRQALEERNNG